MLKSYLKSAFRSLWKNKSFSLITISGLALAMGGAILLLIWIQNAVSMDRFHANGKSLYKVYQNVSTEGWTNTVEVAPAAIGQVLQEKFPEIKRITRISAVTKQSTVQQKSMALQGEMVDPAFLQMFSFPLLAGDAAHVLSVSSSIVITEQLAHNLFNQPFPIYETILLDGKNYTITGILKDLPVNTRFRFDFLLPWEDNAAYTGLAPDDQDVELYIEGRETFSMPAINKKLHGLLSFYHPKIKNADIFLFPMEDVWLYGYFWNGKPSGGLINAVYTLGLVVVILLLIGSINFINLSTARSERRTREIGIRKVNGASRSDLIKQFLLESIVLSFIAAIIGLIIAQLVLPYFNLLVQQHLGIAYRSFQFWGTGILFVVLTGTFAGIYPAFYLSSFNVLRVIKNDTTVGRSNLAPRKILVVVQFVIAIVMINFSYALYKQTNFIKQRDTGFAMDELLFQPMSTDLATNFILVQQALLNSGIVQTVNRSGSLISRTGSPISSIRMQGQQVSGNFEHMTVDHDFITTNGLQLVNGRDINMDKFPNDNSSCLLNQSAVAALGIKNPIGQSIEIDSISCTVVGVLDDFVNGSPYQAANPLIVTGSNAGNFMNIRIKDANNNNYLPVIRRIIKKFNPTAITEVQFIADDYARKLRGPETSLGLVAGFAVCAIFISCLGILGLGAFMAESRKKEIGIRKVLGATVSSIVHLLSQSFLKLVLLAVLIASPIAWLLMQSTLQNFYYRVSLGWWMLAGTGLLALIIAAVTLGFVVINAARTVLVGMLKSE